MHRTATVRIRARLVAAALALVAAAAPGSARGGIAPEPLPTPDPTCGNGRFDWDEECDDGNLEAGDDCPVVAGQECRYSSNGVLIHGDPRSRRVRERGCLFAWYVVNPHQPPNRAGTPDERQACRDQDPTCDFDPAPGRCGFRVVACLNNDDVNLPQCEPTGISALRIARPQPSASPGRAQANANFAGLAHAIEHLHDPGDPHFGWVDAPALRPRDRNYCSAPFVVGVERGRRGEAKEKLVVDVWDWASEPRRKFRSTLRLQCTG